MIVLAIRSSTLEGAGVVNVIVVAMGQAFFTLSLGIGAIAIFGSYIDKKRSLTGEAFWITILDTCVASGCGIYICARVLDDVPLGQEHEIKLIEGVSSGALIALWNYERYGCAPTNAWLGIYLTENPKVRKNSNKW